MLRITDDDLLLFKYLFEEQHIKREFINDYLWGFKHKSTKEIRLSKLIKNGFIESKPDPLNIAGGTYLIPTKKALNYYDLMFEERVTKINKRGNTRLKIYKAEDYKLKSDFDINSIVHHYFLTELRFILENWGVDYWESESMFFPSYAKNPDSIFKIQAEINNEMKELNIALEFERRKKYRSNYEDIFRRYTKVRKTNFDFILYIAYEEQFYNFFMKNLNMSFYPVDDNSIKKYRITKYQNLINGEFITENPYLNLKINFKNSLDKFLKYKKEEGLI